MVMIQFLKAASEEVSSELVCWSVQVELGDFFCEVDLVRSMPMTGKQEAEIV